MSGGFGTSGWGTSGFGGEDAALSVLNAFPISTHELLVTLSKPPLAVSGFVTGDVANPRSWAVTRVTSGAPDVQLDVVGTAPYEPPLRWVVRTLQPLPGSAATGRLSIGGRPSSAALRDAGGAVATGTLVTTFVGVTEHATSTPEQVATTATGSRDLRNVPAPQFGDTSIGGTLSVVGGDYALTSGTDLVKKLIVRRLTTTPGDFFHLPNYGVGLAVKQPLPAGSVVRLQKRIQQQLLLEPDIRSVSVSVTQSLNLLTVSVSALVASSGQQVTVALNSTIGQ